MLQACRRGRGREVWSAEDAMQALPQKRYGALELERIVVVVEISSFRSSRPVIVKPLAVCVHPFNFETSPQTIL